MSSAAAQTPAQKKLARKRLMQKLGIEATSLLQGALQAGGGAMKRNEYRMFWEQVDGPTEATWMLCEIAQQINKQLEGGAKGAALASAADASAAGVGGAPATTLDSLLTTFNFILLTLELLTADKKLKDVLTAWAKIEAVQGSSKNLNSQHPLFNQAKEVYRLLTLRVENTDVTGPLILKCTSMYGSIREFERMMDVLNYATVDDALDLRGGESSFYYEYLKRLALTGVATPNTTAQGKTPLAAGAAATTTPVAALMSILANTVSKIVTLPQQMKMNPKVAETTFCALFHLLRNLMALHAVTDTNFLRMTLSTLQPFYLWPQPYGGLTRDLLIQLQEEALMPGSLLRARLEQELHTTPYLEQDSESLSSALFYVYSADDKLAQSYLSVLDMKPFKLQTLRRAPAYAKESDGCPALATPTTQAMVMLNMLASDPSTSGGVEDDLLAMRQANGEQVYAMYKRAQATLRDVQDRPNEAREIRTKGLQEIRQQLRAAASQSDKRDLVRLPEKLVAPFSPSLPPVAHLSLSTRNSATFHFDARDQWRMIGHKVAPFVHVPLVEEMMGLFQMYRDAARVTPLAIRLMLAGSDELVHQVVCAWCAIKQTKPELLDGLTPKFYLLPFAKNHLAAFLARHDAWYNRHMYVPSRSLNFMVPWVRVDAQDLEAGSSSGPSAAGSMEDDSAELPPPGQYLRRSMESYAREAALTLEPFIYQLEGYLTAESEGLRPSASAKVPGIPGPDHLVPFLQRAEFGVLPAAAEWKRSRKLPDSVRLEDVASGASALAKGFEYVPVEVIVKFTKMDLQGVVTEVVTEDASVYQSLLVSNVPRKNDPTFPPNPTYPNLEMGARMHKGYNAAKSANLGRKNVLSADPKQHVVEVEVWTANPNQTFGVLLDNQYFGPFHRVKLLPCFDTFIQKGEQNGVASSSGKRMTFPIQTFFPLDM